MSRFKWKIYYTSRLKCMCFCYILQLILDAMFITARKRSLGQGNIFTPVCHSVHRGGMRGCSQGGMHGCSGGHVWLFQGGVHGCSRGGMCGFIRGGMCGFIWGKACVVLFRGHAWFYSGGACVVFSVFSDTMRHGQ